jgi:tripartite-type tricarboxylate transporter receptor subunit TctC
LPDVPTFTELGYKSFEPRGWYGLFAPSATPQSVVEKLNVEINQILRKPEIIKKIVSMGWSPGGGTSEDFATAMRTDLAIYSDIAKTAGITLSSK